MTKHDLEGWQPLTQAAKTARCSHQMLRQLIIDGKLEQKLIYGRVFVPKPLKYKPDSNRQKTGRINRNGA